MISNQILQNTIEGLKAIARVDFCVMDTDGKEAASTAGSIGLGSAGVAEFAKSPADSQEIQGYQYFKIYDEQQLEYVLVAAGTGEDVYMVGKMAAFQIQNLFAIFVGRIPVAVLQEHKGALQQRGSRVRRYCALLNNRFLFPPSLAGCRRYSIYCAS